jgi:hypothetical protein
MNDARQEGIAIGTERGKEEGRIHQLIELYHEKLIDYEILVAKLNKPEAEVQELLRKYEEDCFGKQSN